MCFARGQMTGLRHGNGISYVIESIFYTFIHRMIYATIVTAVELLRINLTL
jgi:hypothetical protein